MKVLVINSVPTQKNGITNVIFNYLRAMDTTDIRLDVLSINTPDQSYITNVKEKGGNLIVLPRSGKGLFAYFKSLRNLVRTNKYDAVHIHGNSHTLAIDLMAVKMGGCRVRIAHSHNTTCKYKIVHKLLTPVFNYACTHRMACGYDAGVWMFGKLPFKVLNNGIDTTLYSFNEDERLKIRAKYNFDGSKVLGHVGFFNKAKNQTFLITVLHKLIMSDLDYRLLLIGDGPLKKDVEAYAENLGVRDRVVFTGGIDNVYAYLNAIDIIVMPSLYEGLPLTLIEQQANGLQCFVADTISKESDKTGNLSFLSLNRDVAEWAISIDNFESTEGRAERSLRAIASIKQIGYDITEESKKLKAFYFETTAKNNC